MKFGDTLRQRSIPEWGHYNIDYGYLKDLIKHNTTSGTGKAVSIPGQGETREKDFSDSFLRALKTQHDRISLIIRSKSGEIGRRLDYINKSLLQLRMRQEPKDADGQLSVRAVERYARVDSDIAKAGEEIRSLSRFQVAQRTGFSKIIKKYQRWTRDKDLASRFKEDITSSPDSFYQLDLGYLLDQYTDVLGALRSVIDASSTGVPSKSTKVPSPASRLSHVSSTGTDLDLDVALAVTPLGAGGSKATYWVHDDYRLEVELLLLQYMRPHTLARDSRTHPKMERRRSSTLTDKLGGAEDIVGLLVIDHPEAFAVRHNASTVGSIEEVPGTTQTKSAASARWTQTGDVAIVAGLHDTASDPGIARVKRKRVAYFLDTSVPFFERYPSYAQRIQDAGSDETIFSEEKSTRKWLADHKQVRPVAGICSRRARFVGLHNNATSGAWATFDTEVFMKGALAEDLKAEDWVDKARSGAHTFPHGVLQIRREGDGAAALMKMLDKSHLVERILGFSMEVHAVWTCCKPAAMSSPFWCTMLEKDIRKLPPPTKRQKRKGATPKTSPEASHVTPPHTSGSTNSLDGGSSVFTARQGESSATSAPEFVDPPSLQAFRKKKKAPLDTATPEPEAPRYWNEYDNPESGDEAYYIYVDPDASVKFPGQELLEAIAAPWRKLFGMQRNSERASLLSTADSDEDSPDEQPAGASYGTFASSGAAERGEGYFSGLFRGLRDPHHDVMIRRENERARRSLFTEIEEREHKNEMTKYRFYSTCLAMAIVIDLILGTMTATSRRKQRGIVDSVVLGGTIFNLMLCGTAVVSMITRRERLGWVHQGIVALVVVGNAVVDVLLLAWIFNNGL